MSELDLTVKVWGGVSWTTVVFWIFGWSLEKDMLLQDNYRRSNHQCDVAYSQRLNMIA